MVDAVVNFVTFYVLEIFGDLFYNFFVIYFFSNMRISTLDYLVIGKMSGLSLATSISVVFDYF
jgi:hypothetical protein